jgi:pyruvate kinase
MISNTSEVPLLSGGLIDLDMVKKPTKVKDRQTKIICTIGPACWEVEQLELLMETGMDVARLNFSHGDHPGHQLVLDRLRTAAANKNRDIGKSIEVK